MSGVKVKSGWLGILFSFVGMFTLSWAWKASSGTAKIVAGLVGAVVFVLGLALWGLYSKSHVEAKRREEMGANS